MGVCANAQETMRARSADPMLTPSFQRLLCMSAPSSLILPLLRHSLVYPMSLVSCSAMSPHPALPPPGGKGHMPHAPVACRTVLPSLFEGEGWVGGGTGGVLMARSTQDAKAGATSLRKRLSWPCWSHDVRRKDMCCTPASKYACNSSMHCFGLPAAVQPSTNGGLKLAV